MSDDMMRLFEQLEGPVRERIVKAPINYMGSKFASAKQILEHLPIRDTWVEVFGGSGVLTLNRVASKLEVYNDKWGGLTAIYKCLHDPKLYNEFIDRTKLLPHSREFFIWCKETEDKAESVVDRAIKAYYLIQTSFAGRAEYFGRVLKGTSNIWKKIEADTGLFFEAHKRFRTVQIENIDYRQCMKDYDSEGTVHYLDPPYFASNVYRYSINHEEMIDTIFSMKGFVALSGYDNPLYAKQKWDHIYSWRLKNTVATMATSDGATMENADNIDRTNRTEYLWIKEAK